MRQPKVKAATFVLLALLGLAATTLILAFGPSLAGDKPSAAVMQGIEITAFLLDLLLMAGVVCGFGYAVTGYPSGVAMSSYNDYSLSKLQMALWTIVVLASLLVIAKIRLLSDLGASNPLNIEIPGDLLAAMGIAAFTTAATPAILALKASQEPDTGQVSVAQQRVAMTTGTSVEEVTATGNAIGRISPDTASWLDIVTGDEAANAGTVDLSKVQQLIITLLLLGVYIGAVIRLLATATSAADLNGLPSLSPEFVGLLALSHAGYLTYKAVPKSGQTAPEASADATTASAPGSVPVRLAIDEAASVTGLQVAVDNQAIALDDGCAEISLGLGRHTFAALGIRDGQPVSGTLTVALAAEDVNKPIALALK